MRRAQKTVPPDAPFQPAHRIKKRFGVSSSRLQSLALGKVIRTKSATAVFLTYSVEDLVRHLEESGAIAAARAK